MCGIVGILLAPHAREPRALSAIAEMAATLHHRGPDGDGFWLDSEAGIALGHRRLAIIDLSDAGRQPMLSSSERFVMTFNGEVYNFAELRSKLELKGYRFRGHSDSEVMLAAFEVYGIEAALRQFAGMFALGLWDRKERVLHLVRDRVGKKPLYVAAIDKGLLFASELRAIRAYPGFQPRVNGAALAMALHQGWIADEQCIWEGVFKMRPGAILAVDTRDPNLGDTEQLRARMRSWWSLAEVAEAGQRSMFDQHHGEMESALDQLLRTVVRQRMVADVPLGAFLSGGIDSTTVVALMQAQSSRRVRTFTIGFRERQYDEATHAANVASYLGTEHTEFRVTAAEARAVIPELPRVWDEPFADESQVPTLLLSRLARQHVTVALSGDGGDECFGGYARHLVLARLTPVFGMSRRLRQMAAALLMLSPELWERLLGALPFMAGLRRNGADGRLRRFADVLDAADESDLYQRLISVNPGRPSTWRGDAARLPPLRDAVGRLMYRDMTGYLPGDILVKLDRASMAASLEARCPFLDHRVIEFAWRLPTAVKIRRGRGKWLLRRVLGRYVPDALFERPKQGFDVPIGAWLRGPLREWARDLLDSSRLRREGLLDSHQVEECWRDHLSGRRDRARELWAVLMVQAWLDAARDVTPPLRSAAAVEAISPSSEASVRLHRPVVVNSESRP